MTTREAYQELLLQLSGLYDNSEAANIAGLVIEHLTGQRRIDTITNKDVPVTGQQLSRLADITGKLLENTPVQYVLNEAWFAGMKLYVDEHVLVPRPETEELVQWIIDEVRNTKYEIRSVLDIGTGSGCIPVALKKKLGKAVIRAMDVSEGALNVAIKNAMIQGVQVYFMRMDFLDEHTWNNLGKFDIIASNPPYIKLSEACTMSANVLQHEPHLALFVPDDDALLFYRKIAAFAKEHLEENGSVFLEINEALGKEVTSLFTREGFKTELRKDMQGKDRMMKVKR